MSAPSKSEPPTTARAAWTALVMGVMNAAIIVIPPDLLDSDTKSQLLAVLNPAAAGGAFLLHRYLDVRDE